MESYCFIDSIIPQKRTRELVKIILADNIASELEQEWEEEYGDDPEEEKPDFYDMAYDRMGEMFHCWDDQFKQDCIDYYLKHKSH